MASGGALLPLLVSLIFAVSNLIVVAVAEFGSCLTEVSEEESGWTSTVAGSASNFYPLSFQVTFLVQFCDCLYSLVLLYFKCRVHSFDFIKS